MIKSLDNVTLFYLVNLAYMARESETTSAQHNVFL